MASSLDVLASLRNRRGDPIKTESFTASDAKKGFGRVLDFALRGRPVVITKHNTPSAVLISIDDLESLTQPKKKFDLLSEELDRMYEDMQKPGVGRRMQRAFSSSPEEMGRAAVAGARKRLERGYY